MEEGAEKLEGAAEGLVEGHAVHKASFFVRHLERETRCLTL